MSAVAPSLKAEVDKDTAPCRGCRDDFYNCEGAHMAVNKQCWMLAKAKLVTRWRLGWWTQPTQRAAFTEVKTYQCHHEPGRFAFYTELPTFAVAPVRLNRGKK